LVNRSTKKSWFNNKCQRFSKNAPWDGVRNYQAAKNLKSMKKGDQCFFYHSNIGKEIVGIVEVIKEALS
jgi:predicted RNA-binding protein with PUA-like domain